MVEGIPQYGLKAYALFYSKHGTRESFMQSELDWIVSQSMKKKIFALLLNSGWIRKEARNTYRCLAPEKVMKGLLQFKVPGFMNDAKREYAFTNLSAVEIWSDFSYVQRGIEKSPYFVKVLKKDMPYWKKFFNEKSIPAYINSGSTIGEYVILIPADKIQEVEKGGFKVEPLKQTLQIAKNNEMYDYAYNYMRKKYAAA